VREPAGAAAREDQTDAAAGENACDSLNIGGTVDVMMSNLGVPSEQVTVDVSCAEGAALAPGGDVEARVTVTMPAVDLPGIGAVGAWSWTARHREPVDRYVAAR